MGGTPKRALKIRDPRWLSRLRQNVLTGSVTDRAAQISFYLLLSLFPFLFFLTSLSAFLPWAPSMKALLARLGHVMPQQVFEVVSAHVTDLLHRPRPKILTLSVVGTLWTASRGIDALRKSLNHAYQVNESRPFWKTQMMAFLATLAGVVLTFLAASLLVWGGRLGTLLGKELRALGIHIWQVGPFWRWPLAAAFLLMVSSSLYFVLPNVRQKFVGVLPGAWVFSFLWLFASWGFGQYVEHLGQFNVTYGTLGGFIILLLWLYVSSWVFLFGGELNATLDRFASAKEK